MNALKNQLYSDWTYVAPKCNQKRKINIYDDGREMYMHYDNNRVNFGKWRGKIALFNDQDPTIVIQSISAWKVSVV